MGNGSRMILYVEMSISRLFYRGFWRGLKREKGRGGESDGVDECGEVVKGGQR